MLWLCEEARSLALKKGSDEKGEGGCVRHSAKSASVYEESLAL